MVIRIGDPMAYNCDILLGRITKVSGNEGAVIVKSEEAFSENMPQMESVFLEIEGRPVPFIISDSEYAGNNILKLKFKNWDSIEKIREFTGCRVFLTTGIHIENHTDEIQDLKGYIVLAQDDKLIGTITEVIPNPGQWLLKIASSKDKDILIPFHEHFIVSIDKMKKVLVMDLPEGLTEIN